MEMPRFFATTNRGLEDVAASEVRSLLKCRPQQDVAKIFFDAELEAIYRLNLQARTLHRVLILLCRGRFRDLDDIYRMARGVDYSGLVSPEQSFAVRAERHGVHPFTSMDVAAKVGQAIIDSYRSERRVRLKVNLKMPDVEFLCLVRDDEFLLGLNTTGESLHKRHYRVYDHPAALKTTIAAAMLRLCGWEPRSSLLDPMCGGGTIPIEAALIARGVPPGVYRTDDFALLRLKFLDSEAFWELRRRLLEHVKHDERFPIHGIEKYKEFLRGAIRNAWSAGVRDTVSLKLGDATQLNRHVDFSPDFVVANPPYGIRMRRRSLLNFYRRWLRSLREVAEGCTLLVITAASRRFAEALRSLDVEVCWRRVVYHGNVRATLFLCRL